MSSDAFGNSTPETADEWRPLLDDDMYSILLLIITATICAISVFGILANVLNIFIFIKLGFKETINISLVTLAVCDLVGLLALVWIGLSYTPSFCDLLCQYIDLEFYEDSVVSVGRAYFTAVGGCITCLIAFERCMCILRPLQVKMILTKKRLTVILPIMFIVCSVPYAIFFYTASIELATMDMWNETYESEDYEDYGYHEIDQAASILVMTILFVTYTLVTTFTVIIIWKLTSQSQWRAGQVTVDTSAGPDAPGKDASKKGLSQKDKRATTTVTIIAVLYIACYFPSTVLYLAMPLSIEFNYGMMYSNLYVFSWLLAYAIEGICSSVNIVIYLKTSTRFKEAFWGLFSGQGKSEHNKR